METIAEFLILQLLVLAALLAAYRLAAGGRQSAF
jgi:hypothetical protein